MQQSGHTQRVGGQALSKKQTKREFFLLCVACFQCVHIHVAVRGQTLVQVLVAELRYYLLGYSSSPREKKFKKQNKTTKFLSLLFMSMYVRLHEFVYMLHVCAGGLGSHTGTVVWFVLF